MEIWHLKDAAQIVLLAFSFGQRIYSGLVISPGKNPLTPSFHACATSRDLPGGKWEENQKNTSERAVLGLQSKHMVREPLWGHLLVVAPHGNVAAFLGWVLAKPGRSWRQWLSFAQICSWQSLSCQPGPGVLLTPCCLAVGTLPGGLYQLRGAQSCSMWFGITGRTNIRWTKRFFWDPLQGWAQGETEISQILVLSILTTNWIRPQACENITLSSPQPVPVSRRPLWPPVLRNLIVQLHLWLD